MRDKDEDDLSSASVGADGAGGAGGPFRLDQPVRLSIRDALLVLGRMRREALVAVGLVSIVVLCVTLCKDGSLKGNLVLNIVLFQAACLAIAYDWRALGPTVALQQGPVAAAVAWLLAVFGGPIFTRVIFEFIVFISFVLIAGAVIVVVLVSGGTLLIPSVAVGLVAILLWYVRALIADAFGIAAVFLVTYGILRSALLVERVRMWPYVSAVAPESEEYRAQAAAFKEACKLWAHKYSFGLTLLGVYRVQRGPSSSKLRGHAEWKPSNTKRLFHGTEWKSAKGIVCDGFRLPVRPGMFGTGIYFADCPLKSWRYCFPSLGVSALLPRLTQRGGLILLCEVDLGETRPEAKANKAHRGLDPRSWSAWLTCQRCRRRVVPDSVVGLTHEAGGSLRAPEYVIYDPARAKVDYIFEVSKV